MLPETLSRKEADIAKAPEQETSLHEGMPGCNNFQHREGGLPVVVCMHSYTCTYIYIYIYTYIHIFDDIFVYLLIYLLVCLFVGLLHITI